MSITAYRAEHRPFDKDAIITSAGDHIGTLVGTLLGAEQRLRAISDDALQIRSTGLYVFTDRDWVLRYATLKKRYLYELSVDEADILHSADMMIVNDIGYAGADQIDDLVKCYWIGDDRKSSKVEMIVRKAKVLTCHATPADAAGNFTRLYRR